MTSTRPHTQSERYVLEKDQYVLYLGTTRALSTDTVSLLIDTRLHMLITHGDPGSVRRELDEMRDVLRASRAPQYEKDWLLIEGRPDIDWLNRVLQDPGSVGPIEAAFSPQHVERAGEIARRLLERLSKRMS